MVLSSKGFIKSLEAVMASAILLVFVMGIFPNMQPTSEINNNVFALLNFIENSDNSTFRTEMVNTNLNYFSEQVNTKFPTQNIKMGLLEVYSDQKTLYTAENNTINFNKSKSAKDVLYIFLKSSESLNIFLNDGEIYSDQESHEEHFLELEISELTVNGINKLNIAGDFSKLVYLWNSYYYSVQQVPEKETIESVSYFISGTQKVLQPRALVMLR